MFFKREDILKIHNALLQLGVKDSELPNAEPVTYDNTLSIVQEGKNKQIGIKDFFNQISLWKKEDFINITAEYDKYNISLLEAINLVPTLQRKNGLVITFQDVEGNWEIYQFRGDITEFFEKDKWFDLYDYRNYIVQSIVPDEEDLTASTPDENGNSLVSLKDRVYDPTSFNGKGYKILRKNIQSVNIASTKITITEVPSSDGTLSFTINGKETQIAVSASTDNTTALVAQKVATALQASMTEYDVSIDASLITLTRKSSSLVTPSIFSANTTGVVCTITDSTKREFRNILMSNMINKPNTIYEIRYDFDLNGKTLELPENCTLKFEGGSLGNGTIKGDKTRIIANIAQIFSHIKLLDSFVLSEILPQYFGALGDGIEDDTVYLQECVDIGCYLNIPVKLCGNFKISKPIKIGSNTNILGIDSTKLSSHSSIIQDGECDIIEVDNSYFGLSQYVFNVLISNVKLVHNITGQFNGISFIANENQTHFQNSKFENVRISNCKRGINFSFQKRGGILYNVFESLYLRNNIIGFAVEQTASESAFVNLNRFSNCDFSDNHNIGILINISNSFTSNTIAGCSFESIGMDYDDDTYHNYGSSALCILAGEGGVNLLQGNYIERIYPVKNLNDDSKRSFPTDINDNFLVASIVLSNSSLTIDSNHFFLYWNAINVRGKFTSLYTQNNKIKSHTTYNDGYKKKPFVRFFNNYNENELVKNKFDPLYNCFVFNDKIDSPSESLLDRYFNFMDKTTQFWCSQVNITDTTNLPLSKAFSYGVSNYTVDNLNLFIGADNSGNGLYPDSTSGIVQLLTNRLNYQARSLNIYIIEDTIIDINNNTHNFENENLIISSYDDSVKSITAKLFTSLFNSKNITFKNLRILYEKESCFGAYSNVEQINFINCEIVFQENNIGAFLIFRERNSTKVSFHNCKFTVNGNKPFLFARNGFDAEVVFDNTPYENVFVCSKNILTSTNIDNRVGIINFIDGWHPFSIEDKEYVLNINNKWYIRGNKVKSSTIGTTSQRPTDVKFGFIYKDTTLNKLIIWDGTAWVNMDGTALTQ